MSVLHLIYSMLSKIERTSGENRKLAIAALQDEVWRNEQGEEELNDSPLHLWLISIFTSLLRLTGTKRRGIMMIRS